MLDIELEKKLKLEYPIFQLFYHVLSKDVFNLHTWMTFQCVLHASHKYNIILLDLSILFPYSVSIYPLKFKNTTDSPSFLLLWWPVVSLVIVFSF